MTNKWNTIPSDDIIAKTFASLKANNINVHIVENKERARKLILEIIPEGDEVMTYTSKTLDALGIPDIINKSGKYKSVRNTIDALDREKQAQERKQLGSAPEWAIGSVQAVTQDGKVLIASGSGSQLPAYAYGASHVVWVVGAQKIVANIEDGFKRIYGHSLPLESARINEVYNTTVGSNPRKVLIVNSEGVPSRITLIFVKEVLGY